MSASLLGPFSAYLILCLRSLRIHCVPRVASVRCLYLGLYLERFGTTRELVRDRFFLTRRQVGDEARFDVAAMARELTPALQECASPSNDPPRVLFDWSGVTSWPYKASSQKDIEFWQKTVPQIFRAAFVHARRWDSQAALLAALLRAANAEVRSFSPAHLDDAISWLVSDPEALDKGDEMVARRNWGARFKRSLRVGDGDRRTKSITGS
jgi:SpoIIAA-like